MAELDDLFPTASNNTALFPEGMAIPALNDSARELLAMIARHFGDTSGQLITAGSANAYSITTQRGYPAYKAGMAFLVRFHVPCNAAPTFTVAGLLAKALIRQTGSAIEAGDITANFVSWVVYDAANDRFNCVGLDDREKAASYNLSALPASAADRKGVLYLVNDPPGASAEPALAYDTGTRVAHLRERMPQFTSAAGATQRPASTAGTSGKWSLRTDHPEGVRPAIDIGTGWYDLDDILLTFTTATLPAFGNAGRIVYDSTTKGLQLDDGTAWRPLHTQMPTFTVSTLPAATGNNARTWIYVSNAVGGAVPCYSDGTNWRRSDDKAIVA